MKLCPAWSPTSRLSVGPEADNRVVIRFADESRIVALIGEAEPAIGEGEGDGGPSALAEAVHQIDVSLCCYDAFLQREAVDVCMCQGRYLESVRHARSA